MDGKKNKWMEGRINGLMDGWMDGRKDEGKDKWMDGWIQASLKGNSNSDITYFLEERLEVHRYEIMVCSFTYTCFFLVVFSLQLFLMSTEQTCSTLPSNLQLHSNLKHQSRFYITIHLLFLFLNLIVSQTVFPFEVSLKRFPSFI